MITEDYVSFETAKLLKEKGFDGLCYKVWESHGDSTTLVGAAWFVEGETVVNRELVDTAAKRYADEWNLNDTFDGYLAPTLQMAMKWLKNIHDIVCSVGLFTDFPELPPYWSFNILKQSTANVMYEAFDIKCETYEEACEAAIKYCLDNLI